MEITGFRMIMQLVTLHLTAYMGEVQGLVGCRGARSQSQKPLKYLWGDALVDSFDCLGPQGQQYPHQEVAKLGSPLKHRGRMGKALFSDTQDPHVTRQELLSAYALGREGVLGGDSRAKREAEDSGSKCVVGGAPPRLCKSSYNTTAPMYGVSLTSGQPVTIVQKFPDLLQQVIYETCDSSECDLLHGECIQTYVPYLFLVIPLGPVTLTGQDYVLVESGCTCRPKYATPGTDPNPKNIIPNFN